MLGESQLSIQHETKIFGIGNLIDGRVEDFDVRANDFLFFPSVVKAKRLDFSELIRV